MARRVIAALGPALCFVAALVQTGQAQTLARLSVASFDLTADTALPKIDVPFHLVLRLRVRERVPEIQNVNLPILAELELLGDERQTASSLRGTFYRETIAVVAHTPGAIAIAPATLVAVDARDGKPKEWYTNGLALRVAGASSNLLTGQPAALIAASLSAFTFLLRLMLWVFALNCIAVVVLLLVLRRIRLHTPPTRVPALTPEYSDRRQAQDALTVLRAERTRSAAGVVRAAIWRMVGAAEGETLSDVLRRAGTQQATIRQLLIALERSAFTHDGDLHAAIDDACSALERYLGCAP